MGQQGLRHTPVPVFGASTSVRAWRRTLDTCFSWRKICRVQGSVPLLANIKASTLGGVYIGGPAYTFSKPENPAELIDDLVLLHTKLVDLGVVYRNGKVYLADLEETDV